jgi:hypothetical protein
MGLTDRQKVNKILELIEQHREAAAGVEKKFKDEFKETRNARSGAMADAWALFEADLMILRLEAKEVKMQQ